MELKTRVEYLYPLMAPRMVEKVENLVHDGLASNGDIVDWDYNEYRERTKVHPDPAKLGLNAYDPCMNDYYRWQHQRNTIYMMDYQAMRWDNKAVGDLANYLCNHPESIPYFIKKNTIEIIGLLMGARDFHKWSGRMTGNGDPINCALWSDEWNFKYALYSGQVRLSLFANVLSVILDKGINLDEFKIVTMNTRESYKTMSTKAWYEGMTVEDFKRGDGMEFTREELFDIINFDTLSEFFENVAKLGNMGCLLNFSLGDIPPLKTIELGTVLPSVYEIDTYKVADLGEDNLEDISMLCKKMLTKLSVIREKAENEVLHRHLERLNGELMNIQTASTAIDYSSYKSEIDALFEEIVNSTVTNKDVHLKELTEILKSFGISVSTCESEKTSVELLTDRVQKLEDRVVSIEDGLESLRKELIEYLEHGGVNPLVDREIVTKEEVIKIVSEYKPHSVGSMGRKINLLRMIKVAAVGAALAGTLTSSGIAQPSSDTIPQKAKTERPFTQTVVDEPIASEVIPEVEVDVEPEPSDVIVIFENDGLKPVEEIIKEIIIYDRWGRGIDRIQKLEDAGYDASYVQKQINRILLDGVPLTEIRSIDEIAIEVIQGKWGKTLEEQKPRLEAVGFDYEAILQYIKDEDLENRVCVEQTKKESSIQ